MLSIRNLETARQAATYFLKDDYYYGSTQQQPSAWWGRGADLLGLQGAVDRETFEAALSGELPNGQRLQGRTDETRRPGFDLTFSAPKSVSLLALVHGADGVLAAHEAAVTEALTYLEQEASDTRVTEDKVTKRVTTGNLLVARFSHDTSRDLDPQLHTHSVVINATRRADGAWRSLSNERLYELKMLGGEIYRASLAAALVQQGYEIERTHDDGRFEVRGFTGDQLKHFSQRRVEIEQALAARGAWSARASEKVALMTREAKREVDRAELAAVWRAQAEAQAFSFPKGRPRMVSAAERSEAAEKAVDLAIEHLAERKAVLEERRVIGVALAETRGRATLSDVQAELRRRVEQKELFEVQTVSPTPERAFVTAETLATERALVAAVKLGRGQFAPIAEAEAVRAAMQGVGFTAGQAEAVELLLTTRDALVGVQGYAGTGKTTALRQVRTLAEKAGVEVRGLAPSASAALLLEEEAGIRSQTLERHLLDQAQAPARGAQGALWIVDEASMVSSRDALRLVHAARRAGARLALIGDQDQLPSVEAGAAFRLLLEHGMGRATMDEILRQRDPIHKEAVERTVARQDRAALSLLAPSVRTIRDAGQRLEAAANDFLARPPEERDRLLVLAVSNAERRALNERIRTGLRGQGALVGREQSATILVSRDLTEAQLAECDHYRAGDVVRFGKRYRQMGIEAGEYLAVEGVDSDRDLVILRRRDGSPLEWSARRHHVVEVYREEARGLAVGDQIRWTRNDKERDRRNGELARIVAVNGREVVIEGRGKRQVLALDRDLHWEHAYATTVHAAQGKTADAVILCLDTERKQLTGHESWYVAISRARDGIRIYTDDVERLPNTVQRSMAQSTALEAVRGYARER